MPIQPSRAFASAGLLVLALVALPAEGADSIVLVLKGNRFTPNAVIAPAGERLRLEIKNEDATPAEFESHDLRIEKIIVPGGRISVLVGPLKPGTYKFFDDYHPDTANGTLTATPKGQ